MSASCAVAKAVQLPEFVRIGVEVVSPDIVRNSQLAAGVVVGVAGVGVLLEVAVIAVRFLNIGLLSLKISVFLIVVHHRMQCYRITVMGTQWVHFTLLYMQDIVLSWVIAVGLTGAGIFPVYVAVKWTDVVLSDNLPELRDIRNCLAATAVSCSMEQQPNLVPRRFPP